MKRFLVAVAWFTAVTSNPVLAHGTNAHEFASERRDDVSVTNMIGFPGCGYGRYRDSHTHKCISPADIER
jgi:hypothetical protein